MRLTFPLLLALPAAATAQFDNRGTEIRGARAGDAMIYRAAGFDAVALGTGAKVDVRVGPAWSVRVAGPPEAFADFVVLRSGDTLQFMRRDRRGRGDAALERRMRIAVTMPAIAAAALGGAGSMTIDRAAGTSFDAAVGGSGNLAIGALAVRTAEISIGGSGGVTAAGGAAAMLKVNIGGGGSFIAPAFKARGAQIASAGGGAVRTRVDGRATVSMVGGGSVDLGPGARCTVTKMGGGRVRCGG